VEPVFSCELLLFFGSVTPVLVSRYFGWTYSCCVWIQWEWFEWANVRFIWSVSL